MALIKCSECGNMISDKPPACIHCGCPISTNSGKLMIKACKYPRESQVVSKVFFTPVYGTAADLYLFNKNGLFLTTLKTGSILELDIKEDMSFYASFYKDNKNCSLNNKTKSNIFDVKANTTTKLQISFAQSAFTTKIIISKVDFIDSE